MCSLIYSAAKSAPLPSLFHSLRHNQILPQKIMIYGIKDTPFNLCCTDHQIYAWTPIRIPPYINTSWRVKWGPPSAILNLVSSWLSNVGTLLFLRLGQKNPKAFYLFQVKQCRNYIKKITTCITRMWMSRSLDVGISSFSLLPGSSLVTSLLGAPAPSSN